MTGMKVHTATLHEAANVQTSLDARVSGTLYGKDFASIYNEKWAYWGPRMWPFLDRIVRRAKPNAAAWLDLCCGTGSLLKLAAENGFTVTGVDISPDQLRHARRNVPEAQLICGDIRTQLARGPFDVATCMFDSLNYLTASRDLAGVFRSVRRSLSHGGIFVFDMNTFEGLEDGWCRTSATHDPKMSLIIETSFDPVRARGRCLITGFIKTGASYRRFQEEHFERGYRAAEIETLLVKAGFSFKKYDGDSLGRPRKRSGRLLYVCRKREAVTGTSE